MAPLYNQGISKATTTTSNPRDRGYPTTVTGSLPYASNPSRNAYPSTRDYGAQPSLTALAERSANYSNTGSTGGTGGTGSGGYSRSSSKGAKASSAKASSATEPAVTVTSQDNTPSFDVAAAYRNLLDAYMNQQNNYQSYLDEMRAAAQDAYDRGTNSLNSAYDKHLESLLGNYDSQKAQLLDAYNRSRKELSGNAEDAFKQAYISNMLQRRNLAQRLSSMGLTGGATETSMVNMANNYGNARNDINKNLSRNLYNLEGTYNNNLAEALRNYNSAVADSNMRKAQQLIDLENALANNKMSALSNYYNMMQGYNSDYLNLLKSALANGVDLAGSSSGLSITNY